MLRCLNGHWGIRSPERRFGARRGLVVPPCGASLWAPSSRRSSADRSKRAFTVARFGGAACLGCHRPV